MPSKFTVFTGLKQAKFCQTGCFGIGAVAYVIPQVPRGGDSRSLGRSKCLPTRCKSLENLTRSLLLALSKIGGKYSNFTPLWLNIAVEQIRGVMGRGGGDEFFDKQGIQIWEQTKHQQSHLIYLFCILTKLNIWNLPDLNAMANTSMPIYIDGYCMLWNGTDRIMKIMKTIMLSSD